MLESLGRAGYAQHVKRTRSGAKRPLNGRELSREVRRPSSLQPVGEASRVGLLRSSDSIMCPYCMRKRLCMSYVFYKTNQGG